LQAFGIRYLELVFVGIRYGGEEVRRRFKEENSVQGRKD
jgi:hypothetical protein